MLLVIFVATCCICVWVCVCASLWVVEELLSRSLSALLKTYCWILPLNFSNFSPFFRCSMYRIQVLSFTDPVRLAYPSYPYGYRRRYSCRCGIAGRTFCRKVIWKFFNSSFGRKMEVLNWIRCLPVWFSFVIYPSSSPSLSFFFQKIINFQIENTFIKNTTNFLQLWIQVKRF